MPLEHKYKLNLTQMYHNCLQRTPYYTNLKNSISRLCFSCLYKAMLKKDSVTYIYLYIYT